MQNNPILLSLQEAIDFDLHWTSQIKSCIESIGFLNFYTGKHSSNSKNSFVFKKVFQRLSDIFHQDVFSNINRGRSNLRTYAIFKKCPGYDPYLSSIKNVAIRKNVAKYRISNHKLMIEDGRKKNLNDDERFCPFCPNLIEDVLHFLLHCAIFRPQRTVFAEPIINQLHNTDALTDRQKFEFIMSNMDKNLCNYISNSMEAREFLVSNPKQPG